MDCTKTGYAMSTPGRSSSKRAIAWKTASYIGARRCCEVIDVAELQRRLSALGFDPGRVDGIFGDQTTDALVDFQRNAGLSPDGICGPQTLAELIRLQPLGGGAGSW